MHFLNWLKDTGTWVTPKLRIILQPTGLILLALSAGFAFHSWNYASHHTCTTGVVTEDVASFAPKGGVVYTPRVRFRASDGTTVQPLLGPASDEAEFIPGTAVPILYPPNQPQAAEIATIGRLYKAAIWFGVFGVVLVDAGLILRRLTKPQPIPR